MTFITRKASPDNHELATDLLAKLVDARFAVLHQLRELAQRQVQLVQDGGMPHLLGLLSVKQQTLNTLQELERRLDPFRQEDPEQRVWRSGVDRQRCRERAEACELLLREIVTIERQCEADLVGRRDQVANALAGVHRAACATQAYAATSEPCGSQFDISCET